MKENEISSLDEAYRALFQFEETVSSFLRCMEKDEFVDHLDLSTLRPCPTEDFSEAGQKSFRHVVWFADWDDGAVGFAVLHFIFQFSVDPLMAMKVCTLNLKLERELLRAGLASRECPPAVRTIVVYDGPEKWDAAMDLRSLLENLPR